MNHPRMPMGPYRWSKCNFLYEWQILNNYLHIHVLRMWYLHLLQVAKEVHWTPDIQESLQLYRPKGQIVINQCNREQEPIPEHLPFCFCQDEGKIQVRGLRSPRWKGFYVKNEHLPMYNFPLVEYLYRYCRYHLNVPTADKSGIGEMHATEFDLLYVPVVNFQSSGGADSTAPELNRIDDQSFRNTELWNDFLWFWIEAPPKGDVGDSRPAHLVRILRL